jgi:hypothetical protein
LFGGFLRRRRPLQGRNGFGGLAQQSRNLQERPLGKAINNVKNNSAELLN